MCTEYRSCEYGIILIPVINHVVDNQPLYEVANPEDLTEKHIAVGFDYSLLDELFVFWRVSNLYHEPILRESKPSIAGTLYSTIL